MTLDIVLGLLDLMLQMRLTRERRPWKFSAVPNGTASSFQIAPRTSVLGYFQPSLRD
jgi:hypothetical protein